MCVALPTPWQHNTGGYILMFMSHSYLKSLLTPQHWPHRMSHPSTLVILLQMPNPLTKVSH